MKVYLDNGATTKVSDTVLEAMLPYFKEEYGNPSSIHQKGFDAKKSYNQSKRLIAKLLHCDKDEIHFTSCGTEASNWAIKGMAYKHPSKTEIITTKIEHHATLHTVQFLEARGYTIHYLDVDETGFVKLEQLKAAINENTLLVSIIYANNEIGTLQDLKQIEHICHQQNTILHIDAVQATCHVPLNLHAMNVDLLSISGHKFHAPKGIGILYIKNGIAIENLIHGGQQENKRRSGTENMPYIIGLTQALKEGMNELIHYQDKLNKLSRYFLEQLDHANIEYRLNGPSIGHNRLPGNINISFKNCTNTNITYYLNKAEIYVSTGSACDSESIEPSHVLKNISVPEEYINGSIRFSLGIDTTKEDVDYVTDTLISIVQKLSANR
ncbi:MAG: aminotransferase class V-fold PLP-dependent enzyme [Candidatus Izimaplasma sp.]|nr:aminotransferase class V-fold PLP-dependent enzyme [Candidatus Izimaplasma bacterium]